VVWNYPVGQTGGSKGATNGTIRVQFDRFLNPDTANRQAFCVSQSAKPDDCLSAGAGQGTTLSVEYDPVDRVVVLHPPPKGLDVGLYKVRVLPPKNDADQFGIRAFDGVPMAKEFSFEFTVDASQIPDEPNRAVDFCTAEIVCTAPDAGTAGTPTSRENSVAGTIAGSCAGESSCHLRRDSTEKVPTNVVLGDSVIFSELADKGGVAAAMHRVVDQRLVAPETAVDPDPGSPRTSGPDSFGRNMPFIDPKNPGNSYIVYKMILGTLHCPAGPNDDSVDPGYCSGDGGTFGFESRYRADSYEYDAGGCNGTIVHHADDRIPYGAWVPEAQWKSPAAGEYGRLASRIRGNSMPPGDATPQDIHMFSAWIAAGAPVKTCPPPP